MSENINNLPENELPEEEITEETEVIEEVVEDTAEDVTEVIEEVAEETEKAADEVIKTEEVAAQEKPTKKEKKAKRQRNLRRLRYGTTATAVTAVVIAAIILLNVIVGIVSDRFPVTLDLSSSQYYTLSDESVAIAENVKEDLQIVVFADEEAFSNPTDGTNGGVPEFDTAMKEFYNALKQYRSHSGKHVSYSFINPTQSPTKFAAYENYGVESGSILFIYGNRSKVCSINDLYALDTSNYYTYGTYTFESKVEKTLAANIYPLTSGDEHIVQVLVGHSEDENVVKGLKDIYGLNGYAFEELTITGSVDFNKDAEVMLIAAPKEDYSTNEVKRIQQWVYNEGNYGHHLMVFTDPTASCPNLYGLLNVEYGIQVTDQLLLETDYNRIQNYNQLYTMCNVPSTDYTADAASENKVFAPQSRRLTTTLAAPSPDGSIGNYGVALTEFPSTAQVITLEDLNAQNSDGAANLKDEEYPLTNMIICQIDGYNNNEQHSADGRVLVCGSSLMTYNEIASSGSFKNEELLLGTINAMTGTKSSISISNKTISKDTVSFKGGTAILLGLVFFTIGLPILLLVVGLIIFVRRRNL